MTRFVAATLALVVLLLAPGVAAGCNIPFRKVGPVKVAKSELRRPTMRGGSVTAWGFDASWTRTTPELNQEVAIKGRGKVEGVAVASQTALPIDAAAPADRSWRFVDDADPDTAPCTLVGQGEWLAPKVIVRETRREVRIAAVARPNPGDRTGCVLDGDDWTCPILTRTTVKLRAALGTRRLVFEGPR